MLMTEAAQAIPSTEDWWLTPEESRSSFAARVRRDIGMSVEEFLRRLDAGEWDETIDDPENWPILALAVEADGFR